MEDSGGRPRNLDSSRNILRSDRSIDPIRNAAGSVANGHHRVRRQYGLDIRDRSPPDVIEPFTDATDKLGNGIRMLSGSRASDRFRLHTRQTKPFGLFGFSRRRSFPVADPCRDSPTFGRAIRCELPPSLPRPRATCPVRPKVRPPALGIASPAPAASWRPAPAEVNRPFAGSCHGLNLSSRPSGPSACGNLPVLSHHEKARASLFLDASTI